LFLKTKFQNMTKEQWIKLAQQILPGACEILRQAASLAGLEVLDSGEARLPSPTGEAYDVVISPWVTVRKPGTTEKVKVTVRIMQEENFAMGIHVLAIGQKFRCDSMEQLGMTIGTVMRRVAGESPESN
jgi:hypothetical protein